MAVKVKEKWRGKEWYEIFAPKLLGEIKIGETPASDVELIKNRVVEVTLFDLINDPNKYYIQLLFKVDSVSGNKAFTKFFGHECTRDFISRIIHPGLTRIDTNDVLTFSDGIKMRIKTISTTSRKVKMATAAAIRKRIAELLKEYSSKSSQDFVKNIISGGFQQKIKADVSKIYPIRVFEFRKSEVL